MPRVKQLTIACLVVICGLSIVYLGFRAFASWQRGYTWEEMDWQQRGKTSIGDFLAASDIGKREVVKNGEQCIEYFAYGDGLPVKTVCPKWH